MEPRSVPRCDAAFPVADAGGQHVVALAEYIVKGRIAAARARLDARNGIRNGVRYRRRRQRFRWYGVTGSCLPRRAEACGECDRAGESKRGGECAADIHCCKAGCAVAAPCGAAPGDAAPCDVAPGAATPASFNKIRCLTAAASSYTAIAYRALWL